MTPDLEHEMNELALDLLRKARAEECSLEDSVNIFRVVTAWYGATLKPDKRERDRAPPIGSFESLVSRMNGEVAEDE